MSELLADKIARLERLNEREKKILDELMADPNVKVLDICERFGEPEQTVRGALTALYKKLEVPAGERDKRGYVVRGYEEAYRDLYLTVGTRETPETPPSDNDSPEGVDDATGPQITRDPPAGRLNPKTVMTRGLIALGIYLVIFIPSFFSYGSFYSWFGQNYILGYLLFCLLPLIVLGFVVWGAIKVRQGS